MIRMNFLKRLRQNTKAEISRIVEICIGLLVAGLLLPIAIIYVSNATAYGNTTSSAVVIVTTVLLPVLAVLGIAMLYLGYVRKKT